MRYSTITAAGLALVMASAAVGQDIAPPFDAGEHRAFDFWIGEWEADWQRKDPDALDAYLALTQMTHRVMPVLSGKALIELAAPAADPAQPGLRGFSIRYFDAASGEWIMAQHWPSPDDVGLAFTDQLRGTGQHGRHEVYSHAAQRSEQAGQPIIRRYTFSDIAPQRLRWDMGVTSDAGATWATPLVMHFNRTQETSQLWMPGEDWFGHGTGASCTDEPHGAFDALAGHWSGTVTPAGEQAMPISWQGGQMLDGCAVGGLLTAPAGEEFVAWSYSPQLERWVEFSLNDRPGEGHEYMTSTSGGPGAVFNPDPSLLIESRTEPYYGLDAGPALRRSRWTTFTADELVVEIDTRENGEADWVPAAVMHMQRVAD